MQCPLHQLITALFLTASLKSLEASPGAHVPWVTYEAESMTNGGGTVIGPPTQVADLNSPVAHTIEMEASGGKAVKLTGTGQHVEFTSQVAANSIVLRYCVPDTTDGAGSDSTISLYLNGIFVRKLSVTSRYSWRYGNYTFSNLPSQGMPRNFFDEVRASDLAFNAGDVVRIQKDADDTAPYCVVDLVDLEEVAPGLTAPAGSLAITSITYGAVGDGVTDCTAALQKCINDAKNLRKTVWLPPGAYVITGGINLPSGTTVQGAGMWHTTLLGNAAVYNSNPARRITLNGRGDDIHLSDFAIVGKLNYRNDNEPNDGLGLAYGIGSTFSRIWVEHTKTGAWLINSKGLVVDGCRFRNTIADGVNLCVGMQSTIVTNCTARGTGDDCFAIWPATYTQQVQSPGFNVITHCTGVAPNLANGGAIYGGANNRIEDCTFLDTPYGCGVLIAGTFPVGSNIFSGTTVAQRCDLSRCGGYDSGSSWRGAVTVCPQLVNIAGVNLNHLNITNSLSYAVQFVSPGSSPTVGVLADAAMNHVNVSTYGVQVRPYRVKPFIVNGVYGVWARSDAFGGLKVSGLTVNGTNITSMPGSGADLANQSAQNFAFTFLPAPSLAGKLSAGALELSWPTDYIGWPLLARTNTPDLGSGTVWGLVSGSTATNRLSLPLDNSVGSVFFRLSDE